MEGRAEPALSEVGWVAPVSVAMTVHASPIWKSPPRLNPVRQLGPTRRGEVGHPLGGLFLILGLRLYCVGAVKGGGKRLSSLAGSPRTA